MTYLVTCLKRINENTTNDSEVIEKHQILFENAAIKEYQILCESLDSFAHTLVNLENPIDKKSELYEMWGKLDQDAISFSNTASDSLKTLRKTLDLTDPTLAPVKVIFLKGAMLAAFDKLYVAADAILLAISTAKETETTSKLDMWIDEMFKGTALYNTLIPLCLSAKRICEDFPNS